MHSENLIEGNLEVTDELFISYNIKEMPTEHTMYHQQIRMQVDKDDFLIHMVRFMLPIWKYVFPAKNPITYCLMT